MSRAITAVRLQRPLRGGGSTLAVEADFAFLREVISAGLLRGPVLEIGGLSWQGIAGNAQSTCESYGLEWEGADLQEGPGVSIIVDILDDEAVGRIERRWPSVLVFNLLEHVYDPIAALRNAIRLVQPGGACAVAGPAVWQLHDFPGDYWRPMPDFFIEFSRREGLVLVENQVKWLLQGRTIPVSTLTSPDGQKQLPSIAPELAMLIWGARKATLSRVVHKVFGTYGRQTPFPLSGLGVVLQKRP